MIPREARRRPGVHALRFRAMPYLVLGIALAATAAATYGFHRAARERDQGRFENAVRAVEERIESRLETYVAVLLAGRGLFISSEEVTRSEFRAFVDQLGLQQRYPGIQGIGYSQRFDRSERAAIEAEMEREGARGFRVWPRTGQDEMHSILYLEPLDRRNRAAIGYDMSTHPVRREAMERARDTGRPAASGGVTLVQEIDAAKQAGFLLYVPLYGDGELPETVEERREQLVGFVYSPFRMGDLLNQISGPRIEPRVAFAVYDGPIRPDTLLHRSPGYDQDAAFATISSLEVAGQTWNVIYRSLPYFEGGSRRGLSIYVFGAGLLVSGLLFLLSRTQARAQEQLRLHARIVDSMSEGVSVTDENGVILYTNPAEDEMFGYEPGELVGQHVSVQEACSPEEHRRLGEQIGPALRTQGGWSGELPNVRKDGTRFVTGARITELERGGESYWVRVQEDITERKRVEAERLALLGREKALRAAAEDASRTKDEFLAMLGHELRNPLAPIVTALDLLKMRGDVPEREHAIIERQVRHLERLVEDLLDVSRITRGKVSLDAHRTELATAVTMATELVSPLIEERGHTLVVDVPSEGLAIEADDARLAQVVANLLSNAAKYTEPGGHIAVSAGREDGEVVLRVRDDGIGIAPETIPRLFEMFTQGGRGVDRALGGLGIGLTLVRSLVELHGGRVEAHSEGPGRGSEFVVRLPPALAASPEASPGGAEEPRQGDGVSPARRILVVDDNRDAADLLAQYLRAAGHDVGVAYDGAAALALATELRPEVAILDIGLPAMDGYELAARLTEDGRPTLIALTGYGQQQDRARSAEAGFDYHFVKPVAPHKLLATLDQDPRRPRLPV